MTRDTRGWAWAIAAGLSGTVLLLMMTRSVVDHAAHYDELLHLLSARGILQTGQPAIADGFYTRAEFFTRIVAWSLRHFGDSLVSARLPALASAAVLVCLVGVWVVRRAGLLTGAAAAILLCIFPATIDLAVFARFYTVHAVLMMLLFIITFEAMRPGTAAWVRVVLLAAAVALVPFGWHFQPTTIIAFGAAVAAMLALLVMDHWTEVKSLIVRRPVVTLGALGLGSAVSLAAVGYFGLLDLLGSSALWAAGDAKRYQFYLVALRNELPLLWPLLPLAVTLAVVHPASRRLGIYCSVVAVSVLVVHSVAAQKSMRYAYYVTPLLCILWAIGIANLLALAANHRSLARGHASGRVPTIAWAVLAAAGVLSQEGARALNLLSGRDSPAAKRPFAEEPDWTPLLAELKPRARAAARVVTSNSMKAMYYLGRYDYELNASSVLETETGTEFGRDFRTGRKAIGTAESIGQVLSRPGTSLVVIEASKIGRPNGVTSEAFAVIDSRCSELSLPAGSGVRVWWCDSPR